MSDNQLTEWAEVVAALREKMIVALAEQACGEKNCEHCREMVRLFEVAVRADALAYLRDHPGWVAPQAGSETSASS